MSITQTYFLAHRARAKLSAEAARPDHNLRLLVGHANLLDSLMLDLADAEREQESWFNQSVRSSQSQQHHHQQSQRHVEWADSMTIREEDWEADSSDSDDDSDLDDEEDVEMFDAAPITRISMSTSGSATLHTMETDEEYDDEEDDEESYSHLGLTRSPSHPASPPELEHDIESSEDEQMPPSPPTASIPTFSEKQSEGTIPTKYYDSTQDDEDDKSDFYSEGFYLPPRDRSRIASGISVY